MLTAGLLVVAVALCLGGFVWTVMFISASEKRDGGVVGVAFVSLVAHAVALVVVGVLLARVSQLGG